MASRRSLAFYVGIFCLNVDHGHEMYRIFIADNKKVCYNGFQNHKARSLLMPFRKRHKMLFVLFLVSIFLMIKNSSIPYFFDPPAAISFIFDAPKSEFFSGVAQMINIFASAYVTSLMFYYMVDYLSAIRQEKKAQRTLSPQLVDLYSYIRELLAMIEYSAKQENLLQTGNIEDMDKLDVRDKVVFCKIKFFKNGVENNTTIHSYNLLKDCNRYRRLILDVCSTISCTPSFSYCDAQIINIISEIQLSELPRVLPKPDNFILQLYIANVVHIGLGKGYQHLKSVCNELSSFIDLRLDCEIIDASLQEIETWQKQKAEMLKQYPELTQMLDS